MPDEAIEAATFRYRSATFNDPRPTCEDCGCAVNVAFLAAHDGFHATLRTLERAARSGSTGFPL